MNKEEVIKQIEYIKKFKTENFMLEVKAARNGEPKKYYDTISSFSNKHGGMIIFGIDESKKFEITGVYDLNDLQKKVASTCTDSMIPSVRAEFLPMEYEGKNILAVKIPEMNQKNKPCYYSKKDLHRGAYTRVGDSDQVMTDYEIYAMQSYNEGVKEDLRPNKRACLEDLNTEKINEYISRVKENKPNFAKSDDNKILKLSGIIDNSEEKIYPTIAGTMIFGEYPQAYYPQLFVACSVIPGTQLGDTGVFGERFVDNKRVEGTIEEMLEGTIAFLRKNMKKKVIISSITGKREDSYEYPLTALREAVANALVHRDYSSQTENIYIKVYMYDDRIVIQNPGELYGINRIEKLGTDEIMETRNSNIIRLLEESNSLVENRHSGIPTMIREMEKMNLPKPEFLEERGSFNVIFRNQNPAIEDKNPAIEDENPAIEDKNPAIEDKNPAIEDQKLVMDALNKRFALFRYNKNTKFKIKKLYFSFNEGKVFGTNEIVTILECSNTTSKEFIRKMKEMDLLYEVRGEGKGKYKIKNIQNE